MCGFEDPTLNFLHTKFGHSNFAGNGAVSSEVTAISLQPVSLSIHCILKILEAWRKFILYSPTAGGIWILLNLLEDHALELLYPNFHVAGLHMDWSVASQNFYWR